jgi:hypothetical protein
MDYFGVLALHFIIALLCEGKIAQVVRLHIQKIWHTSFFCTLLAEHLLELKAVIH